MTSSTGQANGRALMEVRVPPSELWKLKSFSGTRPAIPATTGVHLDPRIRTPAVIGCASGPADQNTSSDWMCLGAVVQAASSTWLPLCYTMFHRDQTLRRRTNQNWCQQWCSSTMFRRLQTQVLNTEDNMQVVWCWR